MECTIEFVQSVCFKVCSIVDLFMFDTGTCPALTTIVDGSTTYSRDADENGLYLPGTVSSSTCDGESLSTGDEERVCQSDSTWTNSQLICTSECTCVVFRKPGQCNSYSES